MAAAILLSILILPVLAQDSAKDGDTDVWDPLRYFVGAWLGHETGRAGTGQGKRTYRFILGNQYLLSENTSQFEPQEKNPGGEVHQDWEIFSYDRNRATFVLRQFNSEGYVNQFILDRDRSNVEGGLFVFVSEAAENSPPGLRARLTFRVTSPNRFEETFEVALPGRDLEPFVKNSWTRADQN